MEKQNNMKYTIVILLIILSGCKNTDPMDTQPTNWEKFDDNSFGWVEEDSLGRKVMYRFRYIERFQHPPGADENGFVRSWPKL